MSVNGQQHFDETKTHGLGIVTCAVFIVGEIAGSGVLALPAAVHNSGWSGLVLILLCCLISAYTGNILGKAWVIVLKRNPKYQTGHVRYPYPAIGEEAYGKFGRRLVSVSIDVTLFGVGVVFIILSSMNISSLLEPYWKDTNPCYIMMIVAGVLLTPTMLGTPADFWFVAVGATCATAVACVILLVSMLIDAKDRAGPVIHTTEVTFTSVSVAFGTICFAFGGHPAFPTFQADMKKQSNFGKAVLLGYIIVLLMYFPVSAAGFFSYGHVEDNILATVSKGPAHTVVSILIILHLLQGFIIVVNPFCQEIEHLFKIPTAFTYKRIISRTLVVLAVLFVALSIPHFGSILALVGGSTTTLLAYILPSLFYMKLCRQRPGLSDDWEAEPDIPLHTKVLNYEIIIVGLIAGVASSYSAIDGLVSDKFTVPCYVSPIKAMGH